MTRSTGTVKTTLGMKNNFCNFVCVHVCIQLYLSFPTTPAGRVGQYVIFAFALLVSFYHDNCDIKSINIVILKISIPPNPTCRKAVSF